MIDKEDRQIDKEIEILLLLFFYVISRIETFIRYIIRVIFFSGKFIELLGPSVRQ